MSLCVSLYAAFTEAVETHRQQAVREASCLRQYNSEMSLMLQQANSREQQLFKELQGQRSLLAETHSKLQQLQQAAEVRETTRAEII